MDDSDIVVIKVKSAGASSDQIQAKRKIEDPRGPSITLEQGRNSTVARSPDALEDWVESKINSDEMVQFCAEEYGVRLSSAGDASSLTKRLLQEVEKLHWSDHGDQRRRIGCLLLLVKTRRVKSISSSDNYKAEKVGKLLTLAYFYKYVEFARNKQVIYYHHLSKTGGTTVCQLAWGNGCRPPGHEIGMELDRSNDPEFEVKQLADGGNCWSQTFEDKFLWLPPTDNRTRSISRDFGCSKRLAHARQVGLNFMANENFLAEPLEERPCRKDFLSLQTLREPVSRTLSHLHHMIYYKYSIAPNHPGLKCVLDQSARWDDASNVNLTCYAEAVYVVSDNFMTRMTVGREGYNRPKGHISHEDFLKAKNTTKKFDVLVLPVLKADFNVDRVSELMYKVGLGLNGFYLNMVRNQRGGSYTQSLTPSLEKFLRSVNQYDQLLWEYSTKLFFIDAVVYAEASLVCGDPMQFREVAQEVSGTVSHAMMAHICNIFNEEEENLLAHHKNLMADRAKRGEPFACGCGWAGSFSKVQEIPPSVARLNGMPGRQKCPRTSAFSPMDPHSWSERAGRSHPNFQPVRRARQAWYRV